MTLHLTSAKGGAVSVETPSGTAIQTTIVYPAGAAVPFFFSPSAFGEQQTVINTPYASWRFDYNVNTRIVTSTTANGGTVTASGSKGVLQTSANVAGSAAMQSRRRLRYLPGVGGLLRFTAVFTQGVANSTQVIGIGDTQDGFFFGYNGVDFGVMRRRAGVDNWTLQSAWNGAPPTFDPTKGNIYSILFQWLGFGFIGFFILDPSTFTDEPPAQSFYKTAHVILYPNTSTDVSILNPTLPIYAAVTNSGNASNITLQTPSATAFLQGGIPAETSPLDVSNTADTLVNIASSSNTHVLTIRNKTTFNGQTNRIPVEINSIAIAREGTAVALTTIRMYRSPTTAGALVYTDVDTNNSPMEFSVTATTITAGTAILVYALSDAVTLQQIEFRRGELILQPGDQLTIGFQNSAATGTDVTATVNWFEQF